MKKLVLTLACALALTAHAEELSPASKAAIADGITTAVAFAKGHHETSVIGTSYQGLLVFTALKVAGAEAAKDHELLQKSLTAVWGGAAANNLAILLFNSTPIGWVAGIAMGVHLFNSTRVDSVAEIVKE